MALTLKRLDQIDDKYKFTVFGYIREKQRELRIFNIPMMIKYLCLGFFTEPYHSTLMTMQQALELTVYDEIDYRWSNGKFIYAIIAKKRGIKLKILSLKGSEWVDFTKELHRFAKPGSISLRPRHRMKGLKIGDLVDIKPLTGYLGYQWRSGFVRRMDMKSGQIEVAYYEPSLCTDIWVHVDNEDQISHYGSKRDLKWRKYDELVSNVDFDKDGMEEMDDRYNQMEVDIAYSIYEVDRGLNETDIFGYLWGHSYLWNEVDIGLVEFDGGIA